MKKCLGLSLILFVLFLTLAGPAMAIDNVIAESSIGKRLEGQWVRNEAATKPLNDGNDLDSSKYTRFQFKSVDGDSKHLPKDWREKVRLAKNLTAPALIKLSGAGLIGKQKVALATYLGKTFVLYLRRTQIGVASIQVNLVRATKKENDVLYLRYNFLDKSFTVAFKRK
ncbi:MAG: hypothetical protein P1V97_39360 [Planctomycetota bacterium]|nr:hypothetical protein [Planctomycetota bacterium]